MKDIRNEKDDFIVKEFKYFMGCDYAVRIEVYFDRFGKFLHFNTDFSPIDDGDISSNNILLSLRDFLNGLNLDK